MCLIFGDSLEQLARFKAFHKHEDMCDCDRRKSPFVYSTLCVWEATRQPFIYVQIGQWPVMCINSTLYNTSHTQCVIALCSPSALHFLSVRLLNAELDSSSVWPWSQQLVEIEMHCDDISLQAEPANAYTQ